MNFSISSLSLSLVTKSPFMIKNRGTKNSFLSFDSIKSTKFSHSFFKTDSNNIKFTKCTFEWFLKTPIKVNAIKYNHNYFLKSLKIRDDTTALFKSCVFKSCRKTKGLGGGLSYQNDEGNVIITQSGFRSCSSPSCGAFFIRSKLYDITSTCIKKCTAISADMIFRISGPKSSMPNDGDQKNSLIDYISCYLNGPKTIAEETGIMLFMYTYVELSNSNITKSYAIKEHGCLEAQSCDQFKLIYNHFANNQGPGLLFIDHAEKGAIVDHCNFVENFPGNVLALIEIRTEETTISNSVFLDVPNISVLVSSDKLYKYVFEKCSFEFSETKVTSTNNTKMFNNCIYKVKNATLNKVKAVFDNICFHSQFSATFSPSAIMTAPNEANNIPMYLQDDQALPVSTPLYPRTLLIRQYSLFIACSIGIPLFYLMKKLRQNQLARTMPRKKKQPVLP